MPLDATLADVTERIRKRSREARSSYLDRIRRAREAGPARGHLACGNQAHAYAAATPGDKAELAADKAPNIGIITAYNDMLSADDKANVLAYLHTL